MNTLLKSKNVHKLKANNKKKTIGIFILLNFNERKMTVKTLTVFIFIFMLLSVACLNAQETPLPSTSGKKFTFSLKSDRISDDSNRVRLTKRSVQKVNMGGLFIAPFVGVSFPLGVFGDYSNSGVTYGAKAELAYSRLYPFVFGFIYEKQKNKGNADFTTVNALTQFDTEITWMGGSLDIILNKFIKSDFTIPVLSAEVKYATVKRTINPPNNSLNLETETSLLTYSAGLAFTIYVFDINSRYTFAKDYSNLSFQIRMHIPLIRF